MSLSKEKLQEDLQVLIGRREAAYQSYHQVLGAISIMEQMLFRIDGEEKAVKEKQQSGEDEVVPLSEEI